MDVKLAYVHGVLDEEIYMEQLEGFIAKGEENKVCRLIRSLYGLKPLDESGIGPLHTQLKRNWGSTLYTLMRVYTF